MVIHANRFRILSSDSFVSIRMDIGSSVFSSCGDECNSVLGMIDDGGLDEAMRCS